METQSERHSNTPAETFGTQEMPQMQQCTVLELKKHFDLDLTGNSVTEELSLDEDELYDESSEEDEESSGEEDTDGPATDYAENRKQPTGYSQRPYPHRYSDSTYVPLRSVREEDVKSDL